MTPALLGGTLSGAWSFYTRFFEPLADGDFRFIDATLQAAFAVRLGKAGDARLQDFPSAVVVSLGLSSEPMLGSLAQERSDFGPECNDRNRHFLSDALVERLVAVAQSHIIDFYKWLHTNGYLLAAIAGPALQERHRAYAFYGQRAIAMRARFEAPVRSYLATISCPIIEPPESIDANGLLRPEYYGDDWAHANAAFGTLVARQLERVLPNEQYRLPATVNGAAPL